MVEFALVIPLFLLVLFGIIDFGLALNDYNSVRQGVREGAREGVVGEFGATCTGSLTGG
jgi:Flp pilus assembly protein TadG